MALAGLTRTRLATALTGAAAVLSLVTGVANASLGTAFVFEPVAQFVPESVQQLVALTGAFTGFTLLAATLGFRRRLRSAWYLALVLLPVTALQGIAQASQLSAPLVVVSLVALPVVALNRAAFSRTLDLPDGQRTAATLLVGVLVYGTVGTYALRAEFGNVTTPLDALYYTLVTATTVGYGDVTPVPGSPVARAFSVSLVVVGTIGFAVAAGSLLTPAIQARLTDALGRMTQTELELLEGHVIVLGYGDLTEPILDELAGRSQFLVVTPDQSAAAALDDRGVDVLVADPTDEATLERAGIDRARAVLAATNSDADDALSVLTARQLNREVHIVAAATDRENVTKLRRAGADAVISPASIGGRLLVQSALGTEGVEDIADRVLDEATGEDGEE
ncbi:MAG: NAD-binding protein [Halobacteriaceae archaeon]